MAAIVHHVKREGKTLMSEIGPWHGNLRSDGAKVIKGNGGYIAIGPEGIEVSFCPHCGLPLEDAATARLLADKLFPMPL